MYLILPLDESGEVIWERVQDTRDCKDLYDIVLGITGDEKEAAEAYRFTETARWGDRSYIGNLLILCSREESIMSEEMKARITAIMRLCGLHYVTDIGLYEDQPVFADARHEFNPVFFESWSHVLEVVDETAQSRLAKEQIEAIKNENKGV